MPHWRIITLIVLVSLLSLPFWTMTEIDKKRDEHDISFNKEIPTEVQHNLANMKGWFTENKGQIENPDVKYVYASSDLSIGFIESGYLIKLTNEENLTSVVKVTFEGANRVVPGGRGELLHRSNYFLGNDSSKWRRGVRNYGEVVYEDLYDGINLVFYTNEIGLKYDFIVEPGADPKEIRFLYEGIDNLIGDTRGNLHITTPSKGIIEKAPVVYQIIRGTKVEVPCRYNIEEYWVNYQIDEYNPLHDLIIDPLIYSTYVGGSEGEFGRELSTDSDDFIYIIGDTGSSDFPTTADCYDDTYNGERDFFVLKLNHDVTDIIYSTYIGGGDQEWSYGLALDEERNVYVTGRTSSQDFPTTSGSYDDTFNGGMCDVFVCKLNSQGNELEYSTFVGGNDDDYGMNIDLDTDTNAYVTGFTHSMDFPTTLDSYDPIYNGNTDVFVFNMNTDGSDLIYSTYIGGFDGELALGIALDSHNNAYICGDTESSNFPTTNGCYDNTLDGTCDVFVFKLNSDGSDIVYSTFVGGEDMDGYSFTSITLDSDNNAYVTGDTMSLDFPTTSACYDNSHNGGERDCFIFKLNNDGSDLVYSTYLGGNDEEWAYCIVLDSENHAYITGVTSSIDFPTTYGCFDESYNGGSGNLREGDGFLCKLNSVGSELLYSTYLGGSNDDWGSDLSVQSVEGIVVTGGTDSTDFPTTAGCYDDSNNGNSDVFILKLNPVPDKKNHFVTISSPANNSKVSGIVTISGTVSINDGNMTIEGVEVLIDSGMWRNAIGTTNWTYQWDTRKVKNGNHTISARSFDGEDYSDEVSITLTVNNEEDESEDEWYEESIYLGGIAVAIIIIIVIVVAVLIIRKRNTGYYEDWDEEEEY